MSRKNSKSKGTDNGALSEMGERNGNGSHESNELISTEEIAARAYEIYEREGRADGRDKDHWMQAEAELRSEKATRGSQEQVQHQSAQQQSMPRSERLQREKTQISGAVGAAG